MLFVIILIIVFVLVAAMFTLLCCCESCNEYCYDEPTTVETKTDSPIHYEI